MLQGCALLRRSLLSRGTVSRFGGSVLSVSARRASQACVRAQLQHWQRGVAAAAQAVKAAEVQPKQRSATEAQAGQTEEQLHVAPRDVEVAVHFSADGVYTTAQPGEILWAVASKCGVSIPTSCNSGSCGTCEMEVRKWDNEGQEGGTTIARTCIAAVAPGYSRIQIDALDDGIWGMDGYDT